MFVSIQLLFLFNSSKKEQKKNKRSFNTASVLIQLFFQKPNQPKPNCFNTASVLIQRTENQLWVQLTLFQYSFCSYSTQTKCQRSLRQVVSIQLLFLFNSVRKQKRECMLCFNTASVLIQLCVCVQLLQTVHSFNTASVLIQQSYRRWSRRSKIVSIQLLFLFNSI